MSYRIETESAGSVSTLELAVGTFRSAGNYRPVLFHNHDERRYLSINTGTTNRQLCLVLLPPLLINTDEHGVNSEYYIVSHGDYILAMGSIGWRP